MPMALPQAEQRAFARAIRTSDPVEVNFDFSKRTAVSDGLRQTICPFPYKLSIQDNLGSIAQKEDRGSEHDPKKGKPPSITVIIATLSESDSCVYFGQF